MFHTKCPNCGYITLFSDNNEIDGITHIRCYKCKVTYKAKDYKIPVLNVFDVIDEQLDEDFEFNNDLLNKIFDSQGEDFEKRVHKGMKIIDHIMRTKEFDIDKKDRALIINGDILDAYGYTSVIKGRDSMIMEEIIKRFLTQRKIKLYVEPGLGTRYHLVLKSDDKNLI